MADLTMDPTESQPGLDTSGAPDTDQDGPVLPKNLKTAGWILLGIFLLGFFTLLKLPEERLRSYIQGTIASMLSAQDIAFSSEKSWISVGLGISYTMKGVTLTFPPPQEPVHIDTVSVSPSLTGLFTGRVGGTIKAYNKDGSVTIHYSQPMSASAKSAPMSLSFSADHLDLGSIGLLPILTGGMKGSGILSGSGDVDGDAMIPSTLTGRVRLELSKIAIDQQSVMGFQIPRINVSEAKADIVLDKAKAAIKTFLVGKPGNPSDDLHANITGELTLGRNWPTSSMDIRSEFSLSPNILKPLFLLDALIGPGKQPDGSYVYKLSGPISSPVPMPVAPGAGR